MEEEEGVGVSRATGVPQCVPPVYIQAGFVSLTVTAGDLGTDGTKSISALFTDAAGNSSTTGALSITLDTTAPTGGTPHLIAASNSGTSPAATARKMLQPTSTDALT